MATLDPPARRVRQRLSSADRKGCVTARSSVRRGGNQCVGDVDGGAVKRSGTARDHDSSDLVWLAAHGDNLDSVGQHVDDDWGERGDRQASGDDLELGVPVAHDVADVGALAQAWPDTEQCVARLGSARNSHLAFELVDLDCLGAGEWVSGADADHELAL
jgi:hypothetical protein